jgi:hypothetical protein
MENYFYSFDISNKMNQLVKNQTYLNKVNSSGFFKYKLLDFDDVIQVEDIVSGFEEKEKNINFNGLKYSLFNLSPKLSLSLSEKLKKIIVPKLTELFFDFNSMVFSYIKKDFSTKNEFEFHQDWSYTNRKKHLTLTGWLALHDIDENNGCLIFTKNYNNFKNIVSSSYKTKRFKSNMLHNSAIIKVPLKKGEIIFFNPQAFRGSMPNNSNIERRVITFIVKPKKAPFLYFQKLNNYFGKAFKINEEYLIENIEALSHGKAPSSNLGNSYFFYDLKSESQKIKKQFSFN